MAKTESYYFWTLFNNQTLHIRSGSFFEQFVTPVHTLSSEILSWDRFLRDRFLGCIFLLVFNKLVGL